MPASVFDPETFEKQLLTARDFLLAGPEAFFSRKLQAPDRYAGPFVFAAGNFAMHVLAYAAVLSAFGPRWRWAESLRAWQGALRK